MEGYKNSILLFYLTQESFSLHVTGLLPSFFSKIVSLLASPIALHLSDLKIITKKAFQKKVEFSMS